MKSMSDPQPAEPDRSSPGRSSPRQSSQLGETGEQESEQEGQAAISLDQLTNAFAEMLGTGDDEQAPGAAVDAPERSATGAEHDASHEDEACEVTPRSILEAMLFVGHPNNEPLLADQVAALLRGVKREEVDSLVVELNRDYASEGAAFEIKSEGAGYRLALRDKYRRVRDKFYGRVRQAKLSQPAIEVLAVVVYNQPVTADQVDKFRDAPSRSILSQLVRRGLLRIERPEADPRHPLHFTTDRFLQLFGLESVDDLPRSEEPQRS
jgi:segregation and condensation protein B